MPTPLPGLKVSLHPRNKHRLSYNFPELIASYPALAVFVTTNKYHNESIDFANPEAVKALNKALLAHFYQIQYWDIPPHYLCPPIPGRADYLHYLADILAESNGGVVPTGSTVRCLDVGVGANCVYPIIGHQEYGWHFVGADIDSVAVQSAKRIVAANVALQKAVVCRLQTSDKQFFKGVIESSERFDLTLCNPPFHASMHEAQAANALKISNLTGKKTNKATLNFGGQHRELWYAGGEARFIKLMIAESVEVAQNCLWFSSLVSKKESLTGIYKALSQAKATAIKTVEMAQGQKISRFVAWTFLNEAQRNEWFKQKS
jgi:23S rRNA (adenine1618-N6)-methyltransferase